MQTACAKIIIESLHEGIRYQLRDALNGEAIERQYNLHHLGEKQLKLLGSEIANLLSRVRAVYDHGESMWAGEDSASGLNYEQQFQIVNLAISKAFGIFEVRSDRDLGIPFPIYEILAKRVFEALEEAGLLREPEQLDITEILRAVAIEAGEV